jgi:uncharacterized protein YbbK (DUF523 family)
VVGVNNLAESGRTINPRNPESFSTAFNDDLYGHARVITRCKNDVTECFIRGACETLYIAQNCNADLVILKNCSPSCGTGKIYDGTFSRKIVPGDGVTAALLKDNGISVISEQDFLEKYKGDII